MQAPASRLAARLPMPVVTMEKSWCSPVREALSQWLSM